MDRLPHAFSNADMTLIKNPYSLEKIPESQRIDINTAIKKIKDKGNKALLFSSAEKIVDYTFNNLHSGENLIVIMSNGSFDGIYNLMTERASKTPFGSLQNEK